MQAIKMILKICASEKKHFQYLHRMPQQFFEVIVTQPTSTPPPKKKKKNVQKYENFDDHLQKYRVY